jgi:hypothetical protein
MVNVSSLKLDQLTVYAQCSGSGPLGEQISAAILSEFASPQGAS